MHIIWQHFSKRTLALIVVLMLITGGLLYLAIREEQPSVQVAVIPTPTPSPAHTTLSLLPATTASSVSALQSTDIVVHSNMNKITGVQLEISYDPNVLSHVTITAGTYFPQPTTLLNTVDKVNGRLSYVLAIGPTSKEASGSGIVATISYTILPTASSSTTLAFLPKTEVTQQGVLGSVLKATNNLAISIPQALLLSPIPTITPATTTIGH